MLGREADIRTGWGCYIAECGIACFWSFTLCQAVYGWRDDIRLRKPLIFITAAGKPFSILSAVFTMCILQIRSLQRSIFWWNFVLNFFCQLAPDYPWLLHSIDACVGEQSACHSIY